MEDWTPEHEGKLSAEELYFVKKAKQEHAETTESARRALQVAERTQEVAQGTLVEVHRQGEQLDKAEAGFEQLEDDVAEASSLLRFMRRWCCFQVLCCCDCFDPDLKRDRTRKQRVAQRQEIARRVRSNIELQYQGKQESVGRVMRKGDPAYNSSREVEARSQLFNSADRRQAERRGPKATDIGLALPEEHRAEIQAHTDAQEQYLDQIGQAVGALHIMSQELQQELGLQEPKIGRLQQRAEVSHDKLGLLAREARRV